MADLDALIAGLNFTDPEFLSNPYPAMSALREATPIYWSERTNQWVLTRFDDIASTLRDRRLGRNYTHLYSHAEVGRTEPDSRWAAFHRHEAWSLLCLEPPDHTRLRRLVSKVFTPRSVAALLPTIESYSLDLLAKCREMETFDLIRDFAQPYSVAVICSMLGVPQDDAHLLLKWSHAIVKMYELESSEPTKAAANQAASEYIEYTLALIESKRSNPDGLLVSNLVQVEDAGDTLTTDEILSTTMVLLEAGHEATVNTLGNGVRALMKFPDQWQRLKSGEVTASDTTEEMLRWDAPTQLFERWALEEGIIIAGQVIEVGQEVAMLFGSGQRDPRRFNDPDRFDVGRGDSSHIGFGGGIHFCVGAPLARQEVSVSVAGLAKHFPNLSLTAEPEFEPTFVIRGLKSLELTV